MGAVVNGRKVGITATAVIIHKFALSAIVAAIVKF
jgi:hypothetical protein